MVIISGLVSVEIIFIIITRSIVLFTPSHFVGFISPWCLCSRSYLLLYNCRTIWFIRFKLRNHHSIEVPMHFELQHNLEIFGSNILQCFFIFLRTFIYWLFWKPNKLSQLDYLIKLFLTYLIRKHHGIEAYNCFFIILPLEASELNEFVQIGHAIVVLLNKGTALVAFFLSWGCKWFIYLFCFNRYIWFLCCLNCHFWHLWTVFINLIYLFRSIFSTILLDGFHLLWKCHRLNVILSLMRNLSRCGGQALRIIGVVEVVHYFV